MVLIVNINNNIFKGQVVLILEAPQALVPLLLHRKDSTLLIILPIKLWIIKCRASMNLCSLIKEDLPTEIFLKMQMKITWLFKKIVVLILKKKNLRFSKSISNPINNLQHKLVTNTLTNNLLYLGDKLTKFTQISL